MSRLTTWHTDPLHVSENDNSVNPLMGTGNYSTIDKYEAGTLAVDLWAAS